jgi:hypothetical protein
MLVRGTRNGGAFGRRSDRASKRGAPPAQGVRACPPASGEASERALGGFGPMRGSLACKTQGRIRGLVRGTKGRLTLQKPWLTARVTASSEASAPETDRSLGRRREGSTG